jgi:hypothetical protein
MNVRDRALRSQDIQSGLQGLQDVPDLIEAELDTTILTGMAARLATHIRGADVFEEEAIPRLKCVAMSLGIQSTLLPLVLDILQEAEFVDVKRGTGKAIKVVRESIPTHGDLYQALGSIHQNRDNTEIETALLETFDSVIEAPAVDNGTLPIQQIGKEHQTLLMDVVGQAGLIKITTSPSSQRRIYYSPQYWDENIDEVFSVIDRHGDDQVRSLVKKIANYQGTALPGIEDTSREAELLRSMASAGMLPSPTVKGWRGEIGFAFTPFKNLGDDPAITAKILEKTRAILACVRYGENFATITNIASPAVLLRALKQRGRLSPHSEIYAQYRTLVDLGVARIARSQQHSGRFWLHLIDTPENRTALAAAIDLVENGVPFELTHVDRDLKDYAINQHYEGPLTARARKKYQPSKKAFEAFEARMIDIIVTQ